MKQAKRQFLIVAVLFFPGLAFSSATTAWEKKGCSDTWTTYYVTYRFTNLDTRHQYQPQKESTLFGMFVDYGNSTSENSSRFDVGVGQNLKFRVKGTDRNQFTGLFTEAVVFSTSVTVPKTACYAED